MSFAVLRIPSTGLYAAQKALEVTGNNIANAGNENYSRRVAQLGTLFASNSTGTGVGVLDILRIRNVLADATWRTEAGTKGYTSTRASVLTTSEIELGTLEQGLTVQTDDFFRAWNQLSLAPNDTTARNGVLSAAQSLATSYHRLYNALDAQVLDARSASVAAVDEVNAQLRDVAQLNAAILEARTSESNVSDLLDERDRRFDRLAELCGAKVRYVNGGEPEVVINGYTAATGTQTVQFSVVGTGLMGDNLRLGVNGSAGEVDVYSGELGGLFGAVNVDIPDLQSRLNDAAVALRDQVNNQQALGFDRSGAAGTAMFLGTGAFDIEVDPAFTGDMLAAAATSAGAPGDGNNALVMSKFQQDASATSAVSMVRSYTLYVGSMVNAARRDEEIATNVHDSTDETRQSQKAVNIDEEMVELVRYQRAFQAAAKAVAVADEVLDTLINRMIR